MIRTQLQTTPLSQLTATFPLLSIPGDPSDFEDAIRKMCAAQSEMLRWLNTFANIKLCDLYENIGGGRNAANASTLLMMAQDTGASGATALDSITISGETAAAAYKSLLAAQQPADYSAIIDALTNLKTALMKDDETSWLSFLGKGKEPVEQGKFAGMLSTLLSFVPALAALKPVADLIESYIGGEGPIAETAIQTYDSLLDGVINYYIESLIDEQPVQNIEEGLTRIIAVLEKGLIHKSADKGYLHYLRTEKTIDGEATALAAVWESQNAQITAQNDYINDIIATLDEKVAALGQNVDPVTWRQSDAFRALIQYAIRPILFNDAGESIDTSAFEALHDNAQQIIAFALQWLQRVCMAGYSVCEAIANENTAALGIAQYWANLQTRTMMLQQHDATLSNMLAQISTAETQVLSLKNGELSGESMAESLKALAQAENIIQCPHTGDYIYGRSLAKRS